MSIIKQKFTFDMPDEYLAQTNDLGLKGEWDYEGPEKIYVFVSKANNRIVPEFSYRIHEDEMTQEENDKMMDTVSGLDFYHAPVEFSKDPVLLAAFTERRVASDLPQKTYTLPGETQPFYSRPDPLQPDHTIALNEIEWDLETNDWKRPFPWRKPHIVKEMFLAAHEGVLESNKNVPTDKFTATQKTKWNAFIAEFEKVTTKYKDYLDTPWMIPFPHDPRLDPKWDADHDGLIAETPELEPSVPVEKAEPEDVETPALNSEGEVPSWRTYIAEMELTEEQKRTWTLEQLEAYVKEARAGITT